MNSRRDFLKTFAAASGVMALAPDMLAASEASKNFSSKFLWPSGLCTKRFLVDK
jgi:hypothetical protein